MTGMLELRTLGPLDLRRGREAVTAVLRQPKRLALLAYLAASPDHRFHRRDTLLGLFWGERDESHARAALRRALYFLRQALGDDVIVGRGDEEVGIGDGMLWSDVSAFEQANTRGAAAEALELYRGDLLEGMFISEAPEFERWLDGERVRLRDRAIAAARTLTEELDAAGLLEEAVETARRWADLAAHDERAGHALVDLLDRSGDRGGALEAGERFLVRMDEEFGIPPSEGTLAMLENIRTRPMPPPAPRPAREPPGRTLLVLPFTVRGDDSLAWLSEGLVDLLSTKLQGAGDVRTIDPSVALRQATDATRLPSPEEAGAIAAALGAGLVLTGQVVAASGEIQITGSIRRRDGSLETTIETRRAPESGVFDLVDDLARQVLAGSGEAPQDRLRHLAAVTTHSLPALKAWLAGEREFRLARYFFAIEAFQQALQHDAGFALASYRLAAALAASALPGLAREAAAAAMAGRDRLARRDRLLLEAQSAWLDGNLAEAEHGYGIITDTWPDDVDAWFLLGDLRFHANPLRGRSVAESRPAFERTLALDSRHVSAQVHLVRIAAVEQRRDEMADRIDALLAVSPDGDQALVMRLLRAFIRRDAVEQERLLPQLQQARALTIAIAFSDVALYADDLAGAERIGRAVHGTLRDSELRALAHVMLAHVLLAGGREEDAFRELDLALPLDPAWGLESAALFACLPFTSPEGGRIDNLRSRLEAWDPTGHRPSANPALAAHNGLHHHLRTWLLGQLAARSGDREALRRHQDELARLALPGERETVGKNLEAGLRAAACLLDGDTEGALRALEGVRPDVWFQLTVASPFLSQAWERFQRGRVLLALDRPREAWGWFHAIAERSPFELIYAAPAQRALAEVARRLDLPDAAARHEARAASYSLTRTAPFSDHTS